ncbi:peroxiredoxin-like family protein [Spirulina sp. CS-785/01]|uniref:peroxiredoxin-like family protein n=1 Tax=Spirulina sp. CS-785/01 TaxID=3021716 RepID=UPI002330B1B6|nr:peroxiredoxin-like family protein [Spirulina sp. CS-785/01]MDB9312621.1 peroxiredoxin-like family protein [Spirulina sp. CS-785/01]
MNPYSILYHTELPRVSKNGNYQPLFQDIPPTAQKLVVMLTQLGDFDSLEYAWWIQRERNRPEFQNIAIRAVGIGHLASGQKFCDYTGFPPEELFVTPNGELHQKLGLYSGLSMQLPGLSSGQQAWVNLMLMCAGMGSPGTLGEVLRGYSGDRTAPQLIDNEEVIKGTPLPQFKGSFFKFAGGEGFQRPFELATLRLRNMTEVLSNWKTYVPNAAYLTQRGGTFWFDKHGELIYEHRDQGVLGFAENMNDPLSFIKES